MVVRLCVLPTDQHGRECVVVVLIRDEIETCLVDEGTAEAFTAMLPVWGQHMISYPAKYIRTLMHECDDSDASIMLKQLMHMHPCPSYWERMTREFAGEYLVTRPKSLKVFLSVIDPDMCTNDDEDRLLHGCMIDAEADSECIMALHGAGANPEVRNKNGKMPLEMGWEMIKTSRTCNRERNLCTMMYISAMHKYGRDHRPIGPTQNLSLDLTTEDPVKFCSVSSDEALVYIGDQPEITYVYSRDTIMRLQLRAFQNSIHGVIDRVFFGPESLDSFINKSPLTKNTCPVVSLKEVVTEQDFKRYRRLYESGFTGSLGEFEATL